MTKRGCIRPEETARFYRDWAEMPGVPPDDARRLRRRAKFYARGFRRLDRTTRAIPRPDVRRGPRSRNRPRARSRRSASRGTARARDGGTDPPDPEPPEPHRRRCWRVVERADWFRIPARDLTKRFNFYARAGFSPTWLSDRSGFRATCPACGARGAIVISAAAEDAA